MDHETRIVCLMYADGCALQALYATVAEVLKAEGTLISLTKSKHPLIELGSTPLCGLMHKFSTLTV